MFIVHIICFASNTTILKNIHTVRLLGNVSLNYKVLCLSIYTQRWVTRFANSQRVQYVTCCGAMGFCLLTSSFLNVCTIIFWNAINSYHVNATYIPRKYFIYNLTSYLWLHPSGECNQHANIQTFASGSVRWRHDVQACIYALDLNGTCMTSAPCKSTMYRFYYMKKMSFTSSFTINNSHVLA